MQLQTFIAWLLQLVVTAIPGFLNQWSSAREIEESLERFPTFRPAKSPRYWCLRIFFFLLPTLLFWTLVPAVFRVDPFSPHRNLRSWELWGMAFAFGLFFQYLSKSPVGILSAGVLDIGLAYRAIVDSMLKAIIRNQKEETRLFWQAVGKNLAEAADRSNQQNYQTGRQCLHMMLISSYSSTEASQIKLTRRLKKIRPSALLRRANPLYETVGLLKWIVVERLVSRRELPTILEAFGCDQCVQQYFSSNQR